MSPAELENFINKKNEYLGVWDSGLSDKTIVDVNADVLKDYIARANRAGRIDFTYSTKKNVLNKLGATVGEKLKNAADVLFVGSRMLEVQMAIFAGIEIVQVLLAVFSNHPQPLVFSMFFRPYRFVFFNDFHPFLAAVRDK